MMIDTIKTSATRPRDEQGFSQCGIDLARASCDVGRRSEQGMGEGPIGDDCPKVRFTKHRPAQVASMVSVEGRAAGAHLGPAPGAGVGEHDAARARLRRIGRQPFTSGAATLSRPRMSEASRARTMSAMQTK